MYQNSVATVRRDINAFLEQAQAAEKYFVGQQILPPLPLKERSAQYPRIKIAEGGLMKRDVTKRNATGTYNEISRKHSWDEYKCEDRGLKERIDDDKAADMKSFFNLEVTTGKLVRRNMMIDFEIEVRDKIFDEAVFANESAKVNYTEALINTCDFPYDVNLAIEQLVLRGVDVNTIVLSQKLWNYIRRTKLLQDYIYGSQDTSKRKLIKRSDIATAFSEENARELNVIVAAAGYDTANKAKAAPSLTQIWTPGHIWVGSVKSGGFEEGGVGRTITWSGGKTGGTGLFTTETWRDEERRGDMLRVRSYSIEKIIDETAGQLVVTNFA